MKKSFILASSILFALAVVSGCDKENAADNDGQKLYGLDPDKAEPYELVHKKSAKRGMCSNLRVHDDISLYGPGVSWIYTWGPRIENANAIPIMEANSISYFPMAWNGSFDEAKLRETKARNPSCEYILAFNEPNHLGQAEMTPEQAAQAWPRLKALAQELGMKIISPALNYGSMPNYHDPVVWFDEFFSQPGVSLDDVAGIAIHCYMRNASSMASFVTHFYKYGKPIWMTEFCSYENTPADVQLEYVSEAVNFLEADPHVFAYAWFMDRSATSAINMPYFDITVKQTPNRLSDVGSVYVYASTLDKETHYGSGEIIPASSYSNHAAAESATGGKFKSGIRVRPTTDREGVLEVFNFRGDNWVEYLIDVPAAGEYRFDIRYAAETKLMADIILDNSAKKTVVFESTIGYNAWKTTCVLLNLKAGKQTIRLSPIAGESDVVFNWFRFTDK